MDSLDASVFPDWACLSCGCNSRSAADWTNLTNASLEILAVTTSLLALAQPDGWHMFLFILTKATLSLSVAVVFSLTISFVELLHLLRQLHLPPILVTTVALLYRYLFVLTDQAQRMSRARASRAFGASKRRTWMLNSGIIGTLAIRSVERAEHVFNAMRARGWR